MRTLPVVLALLPLVAASQSQVDRLWSVYRDPGAKPVERLHALRDLFDNNAITQQHAPHGGHA